MRVTGAAVLALAACDRAPGPRGDGSVEFRQPNAPWQEAAFPGQTRAPAVRTRAAWVAEVRTTGLEHPWSLAFLPSGDLLVTERPGRLRLLRPDGAVVGTIAGVPEVDAREQGGLLDVALSPGFEDDGLVYLSYAEPRDGGNGTAVARAILDADRLALGPLEVVFRAGPTVDSTKHFGARLVFDRDGGLFVTLGERAVTPERARDPASTLGKVVRLPPPGERADPARPGWLPELWTIGHRNPQGAALHPDTGALWIHEHGPQGGDEVNVALRGQDHGWPDVTYGEDYDGTRVGAGVTAAEGVTQPIYYWDPSIAPSGMAFYTGDAVPEWRGNLFVGALAGEHLDRLVLDGERVVGEERLDVGAVADRIRDVRVGPDGALWVLTDQPDGRLVRVTAPEG